MEDDDAPPQLVIVSEQPIPAPSTTIQDTPAQQRVPITLVTGIDHEVNREKRSTN